jgi:hypothetical protein
MAKEDRMADRVRETSGDVEAAVRAMYASYGDPASFNRFLHKDITIWESDQPGPWIGLPELDALRDQRTTEAQAERPTLAVDDLLVDRWDEVAAVARYVLTARTAGAVEAFRVTDVWAHADSTWQIVHHHAEAVIARAAAQGEDGTARGTDREGGAEEMTDAG